MAESLWRRVLFPGHHPVRQDLPRVLVITLSIGDESYYRSLRARGQWDIVVTPSVPEALYLLNTEVFSIALCDRDLPGWDWREVLKMIVQTSPQICFLLTSRVNDEYLWREVVMFGGYDILPRPLQDRVVMQALQRAWSYWKTKPPPHKPAP